MRLRIGIIAALCTIASPARADFSLALGLKWVPVSYTQPVSATGSAMTGPAASPLTGWQTTSLNNNFGAFFLDGRLGFLIGLDLGYSSRHGEMGSGVNSDFSFTQFGFSIGGKFYITPPRRERVSPYVLVDFYKYFASLSTSDKGVSNDQAGYIAGLVSPLGIDAAIGAEYFFTPAFSIGAEVLGVKYAYTEGDYSVSGFGGDQKVKTQNQYVTFYTGISLNYRFGITGTVHVKETGNEEEEKPTRHKKIVVPPPPPPPPSDEKPEEPPPANPEEVD